MEGAASMYGGLKRYWKRKGYERLNGSARRRETRVMLGRAGSGSNRRRRFWRFKITPRVRFHPRKFLRGLRDAYVNFMLRIANTRVMIRGYGGAVDPSFGGCGRVSLKNCDEKMIVQICKSLLLAQAQLVPRDAANICTQIGYIR